MNYDEIIQKRIEDLSFDLATEEDSILSYDKFISMYPNGRHTGIAQTKKEYLAFQLAKSKNSIIDYTDFLSKYPESIHAEDAKYEIDKLFFLHAKSENNINALKNYLLKYPKGQYVKEAKDDIEYLIFTSAKKEDTLSLYKNYLKLYPNGFHKDYTIQRIKFLEEKLEFNNSLTKNTIESYANYLKKYPNGEYKIDAEWNILKQKGSVDLLKKFIVSYPNSKYSIMAAQKIIEIEFNECKSEKCFDRFINEYPESEFSKIAYEKIFSLQEISIRSYNKYLEKYPLSHLRKDIISKLYEMYKKLNTVKGYEDFISKFPRTEYINNAKDLILKIKLGKKKINEIYIQAGNYERSDDIESAIKVYQYIIDKYPNNVLAIKSNDRLLAIKNDRDKQKERTVYRYVKSKDSRNNPCKHVYVGKSYECYCVNFIVRMCDTCTVLGFSEQSGRASILIKSGDGYTRSEEISCNNVPK